MKTWDAKFGLHDDFELPQKLVFVPLKATIEESNSDLKAAFRIVNLYVEDVRRSL